MPEHHDESLLDKVKNALGMGSHDEPERADETPGSEPGRGFEDEPSVETERRDEGL